MPSLPLQNVHAEASDGTKYQQKVTCGVTVGGTFTIGIPEDLTEIVYERKRKDKMPTGVDISGRRGNARLTTKTLGVGLAFLNECAEILITAPKIKERVICYNVKIGCSVWISNAGKLYPNGSLAKDGSWWKPKFKDRMHSFDRSEFFELGIVAVVYDKTTNKRSTGDKIEWEEAEDKNDAAIAELNGFRGHRFDPDSDDFEEMPYSPEAARN